VLNGWLLLGAIPLSLASGFVRGVTGFGGAMVLTAPLAFLIEPHQAVLVALMLEGLAASHMLPGACRDGRLRLIGPICLAACLMVPIGGYLLTSLDPSFIRNWIAGTILVFAFMMLRGFRYHGNQRQVTSVLVGALSGVLTAATSVGGPPLILYLLSGPDPVAVTRANLTIFIIVISTATLLFFLAQGALDLPTAGLAAVLAPFFVLGIWAGSRIFTRINERRFRQIVLTLLIVVSAGMLLL
jgi:hypothetical protein